MISKAIQKSQTRERSRSPQKNPIEFKIPRPALQLYPLPGMREILQQNAYTNQFRLAQGVDTVLVYKIKEMVFLDYIAKTNKQDPFSTGLDQGEMLILLQCVTGFTQQNNGIREFTKEMLSQEQRSKNKRQQYIDRLSSQYKVDQTAIANLPKFYASDEFKSLAGLPDIDVDDVYPLDLKQFQSLKLSPRNYREKFNIKSDVPVFPKCNNDSIGLLRYQVTFEFQQPILYSLKSQATRTCSVDILQFDLEVAVQPQNSHGFCLKAISAVSDPSNEQALNDLGIDMSNDRLLFSKMLGIIAQFYESKVSSYTPNPLQNADKGYMITEHQATFNIRA